MESNSRIILLILFAVGGAFFWELIKQTFRNIRSEKLTFPEGTRQNFEDNYPVSAIPLRAECLAGGECEFNFPLDIPPEDEDLMLWDQEKYKPTVWPICPLCEQPFLNCMTKNHDDDWVSMMGDFPWSSKQ